MNVTAETFSLHSKREIPSGNYEMHVVHCQRNIQLCPKCHEPVPRSELADHDLEFHAEVKCPECQKKCENSALDDHKVTFNLSSFGRYPADNRYKSHSPRVFQKNDCPKRPKLCRFCELELKADTMSEHEHFCGSRTENCEVCNQLVMLKNQRMHEESGHRKIKPDEGCVRCERMCYCPSFALRVLI